MTANYAHLHAARPARRSPAPAHRTAPSARRADAPLHRPKAPALPITTYVACMDRQCAITYISPHVERMLGYPAESWTRHPRSWILRMHPDDRKRVVPLMAAACRDGAAFLAEYRLAHKDGGYRWIHDEARVARGPAGKTRYMQGVWVDVTDRKLSDEALRAKAQELERTNAELHQFVSIASHDIVAPLRRAVNFAELLSARCGRRLDAQDWSLLSGLLKSVHEMRDLVCGLAGYCEVGQEVVAPRPTDAEKALARALVELGPRLKRSAAVIEIGPLPAVLAEPARLTQVFYYLLDNAVKFHGQLRVRVRIWAMPAGDEVIFAVKDNGIGIDPRMFERIFGIFQRLHKKDEYGGGAGAGLAIAKRIVEKLNGRIWVKSEPGQGATFHFALPAAPGNPS